MPARQSLEQASSHALAFFDLVHCRPERSRRAAAVQACEGTKSTAQHRAAMSIVPSSAVTLAGAEQAVRAGIAAAEKVRQGPGKLVLLFMLSPAACFQPVSD